MTRSRSPRLLALLLILGTARAISDDLADPAANEISAGWTNRSASPEAELNQQPDKPTRFDLDVTQLIETDRVLEKKSTRTAEDERENEVGVDRRQDDGCRYYWGLFLSARCLELRIRDYGREVARAESLEVAEGVRILRREDSPERGAGSRKRAGAGRHPGDSVSLVDEVRQFAREHVVQVRLARALAPRTFFGAFGLKKILFPILIGVQIVKSILIALFLPSIIGSLTKIVSKGAASFAQSSQNPGAGMTGLEDPGAAGGFDFNDNKELYNDDYMTRQPLGTLPASAMYDESMLQTKSPAGANLQAQPTEMASRFSAALADSRLAPVKMLNDRYYTRHAVNPQVKKQDFKVFHEIPTSSLLLTNYDPFYSPLLSRLDAVFSRLGHITEGCREFAVCAMYRSPARYAPYSNLVSAQLSRELNELRKPSSDNPDVLRFFRYMKAAKDGQDGLRCEDAYNQCQSARDDEIMKQNQAMLATYQDIDKLVHARKLA